jgi:hypothetical protein
MAFNAARRLSRAPLAVVGSPSDPPKAMIPFLPISLSDKPGVGAGVGETVEET